MTLNEAPSLLDVRGLSTHFIGAGGVTRAVDDVSFRLRRGETLGLVGESGCGKSVTALSIARLVPAPAGRIVSGQVNFDGQDLLGLTESAMRRFRGKRIGFIFQDPMTSLNPTLTIGYQISEMVQLHLGLQRRDADDRAIELLDKVGIPRARERLRDYPHQFSGGMRQRVMISIALACDPDLLLADEPTTALDVTIQAQILDLIMSLSEEAGTAVILITHDLGVAAGMCDRINVMYAGRIVETGLVDQVFAQPQMPYTEALLESLPRIDSDTSRRLTAIRGAPPDLSQLEPGCKFSERCRYVRSECRGQEPALSPRGQLDTHLARCFGTEQDGWIS